MPRVRAGGMGALLMLWATVLPRVLLTLLLLVGTVTQSQVQAVAAPSSNMGIVANGEYWSRH